jgi:preprotein translocase subunit YajC
MPDFMSNLLFDIVILALFAAAVYSFLIMPQQRRFKKRQELVRNLRVGMEVLTYGGLLGKVSAVDRDSGIVTVEVAPGLNLRFIAAAITDEFDAAVYAGSAKSHM